MNNTDFLLWLNKKRIKEEKEYNDSSSSVDYHIMKARQDLISEIWEYFEKHLGEEK